MKKIVLLYSELIPSVRLCGYEQLSHLARQGQVDFEAVRLRDVTGKCLKDADAVIFVRADSSFECHLAKRLAAAGKYLIYVLDDDLLNIPEYLESYPHYAQPATRKNIQTMMDCCDCLMTPSKRIAQKYGPLFARAVLFEEPALACVRHTESGGPVRIGFAGSVDRTLDFERILADPLRRIKARFGDGVSIEFFGIRPAIAAELPCKCLPYAGDYAAYQAAMKDLRWDIGLAPMPDTAFHACKHYNKFIEYGSYGIISVCSDLPPYTGIVRNWENGVLCPNDADRWEEALTRLIRDAQLRKKLQDELQEQIRRDFQVPQVARQLWRQLDACIPAAEKHTARFLLPGRLFWRAAWVRDKIRRHGWKLPLAALRKIIRKVSKNEG